MRISFEKHLREEDFGNFIFTLIFERPESFKKKKKVQHFIFRRVFNVKA